MHACALVATSPKSRLIDHTCVVHFRAHTRREIPDETLDKHTARGKTMGRGFEHFFTEAARLDPPSTIEDRYETQARKILTEAQSETLFD